MAAQLREVRNRWQVACLTNSGLHKELGALRSHLQALHVRACSYLSPSPCMSSRRCVSILTLQAYPGLCAFTCTLPLCI